MRFFNRSTKAGPTALKVSDLAANQCLTPATGYGPTSMEDGLESECQVGFLGWF